MEIFQQAPMQGRFLIDCSLTSHGIQAGLEGNTYSLLETERLLKLSETVEGKDLKEAQMILNHKEAIEFLVDSTSDIGINRRTILNLHAILSYDLLGDPEACGRLRSIPVKIGKSVYNPPGVPQLIDECFQQIVDVGSKIEDPFEQAFFLMVHLPYLQPFEDAYPNNPKNWDLGLAKASGFDQSEMAPYYNIGPFPIVKSRELSLKPKTNFSDCLGINKRVSRLAANIPLILRNLSPLSFVDVPVQTYVHGLMGVYEFNRIELLREVFIWAYERSCMHYSAKRKELGEPDPFRMRYRELIRSTVASIVRNQMDRSNAVEFIKHIASESVPSEAQTRLIEVVETEIMCLHEGNFARYRLKYSEYAGWRARWV